MPGHRHRALILSAILSLLALPSFGGARVDYVGSYVWSLPEADFGGFSGIEISDDGSEFHVISDRARIRWGGIERDTSGRIREMTMSGRAQLQDSKGTPLLPGRLGDSEGLAIGHDGTIWISFEGLDRIARYDDVDRPAIRVPVPPDWARIQVNEGFEALAITPDGALLTLPEYAPKGGDFPPPPRCAALWRDQLLANLCLVRVCVDSSVSSNVGQLRRLCGHGRFDAG